VAAQIVAGHNREVAVALTPVGEGRFEIYLNGDEVYNRKKLPETSKPGADVRAVVVDVAEVVRGKLLTALKAAAPAGGH
jgi:predicted Rdx family selenoprotein